MPISPNELKLYLSKTVGTTASNGGVMSATLLDTVNTENNIFNDVLKEEQSVGSITYVKLFCKQESAISEVLKDAQAWLDASTKSNDYIVIFPGTQIDTQNDINPPRVYGVATLSTSIDSGSTVLPVLVDHNDLMNGSLWAILKPGDLISISSKENPSSELGSIEWLTIHEITNTVELGMNVHTTRGTGYAYPSGSRVSSMVALGDLQATIDNLSTVSTDGVCNQNSVILNNKGTIEDVLTLTIKADGTSFTVNSLTLGDLADGDTSIEYTITNSDFTDTLCLTIPPSFWAGVWVEGDVVLFQTHPASASVWLKRVVPIGTTAYTDNSTTILFNGLTPVQQT